MAKLALTNRDKKRRKTVEKFKAKREALLSVLESMPRCTIVDKENDYIHAEFRSMIFRFVDDAEFYFDPDKPVIDVRSAARLGYSDFGVNRKRMEEIRQQFETAMKQEPTK